MAMSFAPARLAVVLLGEQLHVAATQQNRVDTFVIETDNPAAALRAELDARGLAPRTVAIGLARAAVTVKPLDLPPVGGEMRDMVKFELERHLPFPADDAPFDFMPLPPEGEPGTAEARRVLIAAADRRVVDAVVRLAEEAKLRPVSVTVAAHDLLALVRTDPKQTVAWIHRAGDAADVLLLRGSAIVLSRSIPAEDGQLAAEVRRSFTVARWKNCDAVWVSGDGAAAATGALAELGVPVTAPPYTPSAQQRLTTLGEGPRGALELALAVASGRGLRPLDLIPAALRPRRLTRHQWITVGVAAATLVLSLAALVVPGFREQYRLGMLNAEIRRIDPEVRAVERVLGELERKRQLLATVATVETAALRPLPALRELTEILPGDAWLTMLTLDMKGVELTGQAAQASVLIALLENSPRLERVEFASPVTRGRDREQFRIRAAWEASRAAAGPAPAARPADEDDDGPAALRPGTPPRPAATPPAPTPGARRP